MSRDSPAQIIAPTRGAKTLPVEDLLTGRGFITGKSGSGKSNTASVIAEQLLDNGYNLSIIDPEGEYFALKEQYEILHVGADDHCDRKVDPDEGEALAELTLSQRIPIVLDVSGFLAEEDAQELVKNYVTALFQKEKSYKQPHLLVVEEMHEFLPQSGAEPPTADIMQRVGKRGRKHGLGLMGMSQRPAAVDKDYITQCDWLVWHRLTWDNDVQQARKILGDDLAADLEDFDAGEAYLMTDWDDAIDRVQFEQKKTKDAGATPSLEDYHRGTGPSGGDGAMWDLETEPAPEADVASSPAEPQGADISEDSELAADDLELDLGAPMNGYSGADIETLDRADLEEYVSQLERRNQVLTDEVDELRSILQRDERRTDVAVAEPAATNGGRPVDPQAEPTPEANAPTPPPRPRNRSGVAGSMVEFVAMFVYLWRVFVYQIQLLVYKATRPRTGSGKRQE